MTASGYILYIISILYLLLAIMYMYMYIISILLVYYIHTALLLAIIIGYNHYWLFFHIQLVEFFQDSV